LTTLSDSASLLNVWDHMNPMWNKALSWVNEPMRRIHHSACSAGGKIWLVGGEKDDGSNNALSDHYVFDPNGLSFIQLPSTNGPPDIFGHACAVLPDGRMLIFGGYSQSDATLIQFTTIWSIDTTQPSPTWTLLSISGLNLPSPRRAFAVVILDGDKILIQGGADAVLQNVYSDAWILDTTQSPMVWNAIEALSELGPRYDHFAVAAGSQVVLGCGYGPSSGASPSLQIYDTSSSSFVSSFTPVAATPTNTIVTPSQTQAQTQTQTITGTSRGTPPPSGRLSTGSEATRTTMTRPVYPTQSQPGSRGGGSSSTIAIAVGITFGVLALVASTLAVAYYLKRYRQYSTGDHFHLLDGEGSEDGDSPHIAHAIPIAGVQQEKSRPGRWFSTSNKGTNNHPSLGRISTDTRRQRRDMFADEDTRDFSSLYATGGGSSWSLQSMGAAIGSVGTGIRSMLSRENSGSGRSFHKEDPFSAGTSLMQDGEFNPYDLAVVRPHSHREGSYTSVARSYRDPFVDHPIEEAENGYHDLDPDGADPDEITHPLSSRITSPPTVGIHTLPPLAEQTSRTTDPTSSLSEHRSSPLDGNPNSSLPSFEYNSQHRSSIINTNPKPNTPIRRSDSWWARFAKTALLDRKSSDAAKTSSRPMEFRDPNPAPQLVTIQEGSTHSQSPNSESQQPRSRQNKSGHRKSMSSVQTAKTADSEAIDRIGVMDVIQRVGTSHSHQTTSSTGPESPDRDPSWTVSSPLSVIASSGRSDESHLRLDDDSTVESPPTHLGLSGKESTSVTSVQSSSTPKRSISGGNVLDQVHAYERRLSQSAESDPSPGLPLSPGVRNTRKTEEHSSKNRVTVNYGLAPRPSLFVANPDHKRQPSSES
jgi:hypothetical protein